MQAGFTSCENKIKSHIVQLFILCSRIHPIEHDKWHHHWMESTPPSQWPPGISMMPLSKNFLNTFQVIQLSSPNLLDKTDLWPANSLGRREDTHTLCWSRILVFASPQLLRICPSVSTMGERGWRFLWPP